MQYVPAGPGAASEPVGAPLRYTHRVILLLLACAADPVGNGSPPAYTWWAGTGSAGAPVDAGCARSSPAYLPMDVVELADGDLVYADTNNQLLVRLTPGFGCWRATVLAGSPLPDENDVVHNPTAVTLLDDHTLLTTLRFRARVEAVDLESGAVWHWAGTGEQRYGGDGGPAAQTALTMPAGILARADGRVVIADVGSHRLVEVGADGIVHTLAGRGEAGAPVAGPAGETPLFGGTEAFVGLLETEEGLLFTHPETGEVWRLVGDRVEVVAGGFDGPGDLAARDGVVLVVDTDAHCVRDLDGAPVIGTCGTSGATTEAEDPLAAELYAPYGLAAGAEPGVVWLADTFNNVLARAEVGPAP